MHDFSKQARATDWIFGLNGSAGLTDYSDTDITGVIPK